MLAYQEQTFQNGLLCAMPASAARIIDAAEPVTLEMHQVLVKAGGAFEHVYFVESGIISLLAEMSAERIEIGIIGREGMAGASVVFGAEISPHLYLCQGDGRALRLPVDDFAAIARDDSEVMNVIGRYLQFTSVQTGQTAYANAALNMEARLARWLLMIHDRSDSFELPLTHEFLAAMLGVRRPGVTTAVHLLEGAGLIRAERGRITVVSRGRLEELVGDAYGVSEAEYERLIGPLRCSS